MAYFSPFIDESGIHIPSYIDLRDQIISEVRQIFGDIYLDSDSADYQLISIVSKKIYDSFGMGLLAYNNRTPITAIGTGLDNVVAFANIRRKSATYSTVQLTLVGIEGTILKGAQAKDINGYIWNIEDVTIPTNGTITVQATCTTQGNIGALANTVNIIATPTYGWTSVNNENPASPGSDVETDAELRGRYSYAIRGTSQTVFESLLAYIENVEGVTRVTGYENDTGATSSGTVPPNVPSGLPAHSVTFVVEGGDDTDIANAIYKKKTPGCYTNGTTSVNVVTKSGNVMVIRFYRPTYTPVYVELNVKKLASWNDEFESKMKQSIVDYIEGLSLAEDVYRSQLWSIAVGAMGNVPVPAYAVTNIKLGTSSGLLAENDIDIAFNAASQCQLSYISVVYN